MTALAELLRSPSPFAYWIVGDVLASLRAMPDASVDLVMTSPPFLALRSYLPDGHRDKGQEIGSEPTPAAFIDVMLDVTEELARVLAPHGSLVAEFGDTYAGSGGAGGDYGAGGLRDGQAKFDGSARTGKATREHGYDGSVRRKQVVQRARGGRLQQGRGWPLDKSLCLIPELYRFALAYGFNPFTGRQTPPWRVRNVVRWVRPNPPVGALGDKFRPATSELVVACKARDRYFDLDAVREQRSPNSHARTPRGVATRANTTPKAGKADNRDTLGIQHLSASAPPLDWWRITTRGYKGAHYATYPPELCVRPIKAMCPERVCLECGQPSRRISKPTHEYAAELGDSIRSANDNGRAASKARNKPGDLTHAARYQTVGWTECGHDAWRAGIVLDPFAGTGTTIMVANDLGRSGIGIDLDVRNVELARERVGMWLEVEGDERALAA